MPIHHQNAADDPVDTDGTATAFFDAPDDVRNRRHPVQAPHPVVHEFSASPCSTVIKTELHRNRSNSREHDFDDNLTPMKSIRYEPISRSNSVDANATIQAAVKIEPGEPSPCPTEIKFEPGLIRSNSRNRDDKTSIADVVLTPEQGLSNNSRKWDLVENIDWNEPEFSTSKRQRLR